ncbi:hypothetical protein AB0M12_36845 [Nocardia vinacea]|uniref:effector-associated constant component EACC1 n=1 Tax=Nocardia vinacea TaxID=96468 RepID=UPI003433E530
MVVCCKFVDSAFAGVGLGIRADDVVPIITRGLIMQARLEVLGGRDPHEEFMSLRDWLGREPQFRGGVRAAERVVKPGEMGTLEDVLIVALGSGGAATVLARSVSVWLQQRRSGLSVRVTGPNGHCVEIAAEGPAADQVAKLFGESEQA